MKTPVRISKRPMQLVLVEAHCPQCAGGTLQCQREVELQTGLYLKDKAFEHKCDACGVTVNLDRPFPQQVLEPVGDPTALPADPSPPPVAAAEPAAACCATH